MILVGRSARCHLVSVGSFISAEEIRQKAETSSRTGLLAFQAAAMSSLISLCCLRSARVFISSFSRRMRAWRASEERGGPVLVR